MEEEMKFKELKIKDTIQIMYPDNTVELETISNIGSNSGLINMSFKDSPIHVRLLADESICFDKTADVVCFTTKHKLINH